MKLRNGTEYISEDPSYHPCRCKCQYQTGPGFDEARRLKVERKLKILRLRQRPVQQKNADANLFIHWCIVFAAYFVVSLTLCALLLHDKLPSNVISVE